MPWRDLQGGGDDPSSLRTKGRLANGQGLHALAALYCKPIGIERMNRESIVNETTQPDTSALDAFLAATAHRYGKN